MLKDLIGGDKGRAYKAGGTACTRLGLGNELGQKRVRRWMQMDRGGGEWEISVKGCGYGGSL